MRHGPRDVAPLIICVPLCKLSLLAQLHSDTKTMMCAMLKLGCWHREAVSIPSCVPVSVWWRDVLQCKLVAVICSLV